jgi:hypothetical protein
MTSNKTEPSTLGGEEQKKIASNPESSSLLNRDESWKLIEQENNLINHRVSWMMTAQSFLLGAYVLLKNNPIYYQTESNKLSDIYIEQSSLLSYLII